MLYFSAERGLRLSCSWPIMQVRRVLPCRGVAQPGRAPGSGPGGRRFKSSLPDQLFQAVATISDEYILRAIRATGNWVTKGDGEGMWKPKPACSAVVFR